MDIPQNDAKSDILWICNWCKEPKESKKDFKKKDVDIEQ
jgi:hypothetical protein